MKLSRILAPTDFSRFSGFALEWAANLAEALRAELILLHVVPEEEGKIIEEVIGEGRRSKSPGIRKMCSRNGRRSSGNSFKSFFRNTSRSRSRLRKSYASESPSWRSSKWRKKKTLISS